MWVLEIRKILECFFLVKWFWRSRLKQDIWWIPFLSPKCFFLQADTDGNAWIIGKSGYAPTDGWPSYVLLGARRSPFHVVVSTQLYWVFSHWFPEGFFPVKLGDCWGEKATAPAVREPYFSCSRSQGSLVNLMSWVFWVRCVFASKSIESIFHFVQKQANNQPATLTQGFSIHPNISRNLPRGESQLGWGWGARSWQWRFGLVCYWDSSLDSSTTKLRVPWQVGRAVLGGFLRWGF